MQFLKYWFWYLYGMVLNGTDKKTGFNKIAMTVHLKTAVFMHSFTSFTAEYVMFCQKTLKHISTYK